jgi:hypothetical protein
MTPAWIVYAWPRVLCEAVDAPRLHFAHLSTQVIEMGNAQRPACGQTLWFGDDGERQAGVAWDWVSLPAGLVAMADPMSLVTNLQFLSAAGDVLAPLESVRQLNEIVHTLPWQYEVQRALATRH